MSYRKNPDFRDQDAIVAQAGGHVMRVATGDEEVRGIGSPTGAGVNEIQRLEGQITPASDKYGYHMDQLIGKAVSVANGNTNR